jgi:maltooligosyltrehalose synthase
MASNNQQHNSGFIVNGNARVNFRGAVGDNASVTQTIHENGSDTYDAKTLDDLRQRVARLAELVEQRGHLVDASTRAAIATVKSEAARVTPDKTKMSVIMDNITSALTSIAGLGSAAVALTAFIAGL